MYRGSIIYSRETERCITLSFCCRTTLTRRTRFAVPPNAYFAPTWGDPFDLGPNQKGPSCPSELLAPTGPFSGEMDNTVYSRPGGYLIRNISRGHNGFRYVSALLNTKQILFSTIRQRSLYLEGFADPTDRIPQFRLTADRFLLVFDGGSRGNPYPGGSDAVIFRARGEFEIIWMASMSFARCTTTTTMRNPRDCALACMQPFVTGGTLSRLFATAP
jgi:hypothetical protein